MADGACGSYDVLREGDEVILRIDCEQCTFFPSIEDDGRTMAMAIDLLAEVGHVTKIVFVQKRDYEYDTAQVLLLEEVAKIYKQISQNKIGYSLLIDPASHRFIDAKYAEIQDALHRLLKSDPLGAYMDLVRIYRREDIFTKEAGLPPEGKQALAKLLKFLQDILTSLEQVKLIRMNKNQLAGHKSGERELYRRLFSPSIKPDFMFTKLQASYPPDAEELASYEVKGTEVTIISMPGSVQYLYHIVPPEFKLGEEQYELLDAARKIMAEHKPKRSEFVDPQRMREVFTAIGEDLLDELAGYRGIKLREKDRDELVQILVRYTVGFGLIEVLLADERVQDISINSPMGRIPMFIVHQDFGDCITNIVPTISEAESWASKLRLISGRPLDEANPILDTELVLPESRARVAAITGPLNPTGLAYSFRRHRDKPWTLALFVSNGMISPLAAGVLSFLIDGARTILVAGTRSSGKTSLLGGLMVEIMRRIRIITIEDTLELPVQALKNLNYNIQSMKVASALTRGSTEVSADEGIRTTLRLGDSSLIVGEVRSTEAKALYEAMRVGALANTVAGTIHGDSPYGVFDRVVNDLGVPRTSFKATDIIIVANPVRSPDGLHRFRRVTQITEVRKHWEDDPLREGGFVDLFKYDAVTDTLQPTSDLLNGDSEIIKSIAGNVREWAGNWDAVWDNINLRTRIKQSIVDTAKKLTRPDILEAPFNIASNDEFHRIAENVREQTGRLDSEQIFFAWNEWFQRNLRQHEEA
ncbi:type II/IV secretion system ATPase subunit [Candidatus Woesearchaeota archaeon]|nr:type II/IV secretion system ATPase subunit [Candidatus Woesearchaeota archaeon]